MIPTGSSRDRRYELLTRRSIVCLKVPEPHSSPRRFLKNTFLGGLEKDGKRTDHKKY